MSAELPALSVAVGGEKVDEQHDATSGNHRVFLKRGNYNNNENITFFSNIFSN